MEASTTEPCKVGQEFGWYVSDFINKWVFPARKMGVSQARWLVYLMGNPIVRNGGWLGVAPWRPGTHQMWCPYSHWGYHQQGDQENLWISECQGVSSGIFQTGRLTERNGVAHSEHDLQMFRKWWCFKKLMLQTRHIIGSKRSKWGRISHVRG